MKNILLFVLALIVIGIVWHFVTSIFAGIVHIAITLALIALVIWVIATIIKAVSREKIKY